MSRNRQPNRFFVCPKHSVVNLRTDCQVPIDDTTTIGNDESLVIAATAVFLKAETTDTTAERVSPDGYSVTGASSELTESRSHGSPTTDVNGQKTVEASGTIDHAAKNQEHQEAEQSEGEEDEELALVDTRNSPLFDDRTCTPPLIDDEIDYPVANHMGFNDFTNGPTPAKQHHQQQRSGSPNMLASFAALPKTMTMNMNLDKAKSWLFSEQESGRAISRPDASTLSPPSGMPGNPQHPLPNDIETGMDDEAAVDRITPDFSDPHEHSNDSIADGSGSSGGRGAVLGNMLGMLEGFGKKQATNASEAGKVLLFCSILHCFLSLRAFTTATFQTCTGWPLTALANPPMHLSLCRRRARRSTL
jgi:hypothetical protein